MYSLLESLRWFVGQLKLMVVISSIPNIQYKLTSELVIWSTFIPIKLH